MILGKITKQKLEIIEKTLPDLFLTINLHLKNIEEMTPNELKGIVAGLCIEYVLKSGGNIGIFQDDISIVPTEFDEFTIE